jgi:hypothetical protein
MTVSRKVTLTLTIHMLSLSLLQSSLVVCVVTALNNEYSSASMRISLLDASGSQITRDLLISS